MVVVVVVVVVVEDDREGVEDGGEVDWSLEMDRFLSKDLSEERTAVVVVVGIFFFLWSMVCISL